MDRELADLRRELVGVERGRGRYYPDDLRERMAAWARRRRQQDRGASWRVLGRELGVSAEILRRWVVAKTAGASKPPLEVADSDDGAPKLRPIEVADSDDGAREAPGLKVVTRAGHQILGVSLKDVIEIVRVLG